MKKGFTLVELLGVIIIIGVIATIAAIAVDNNIKKGKETTCKAQEENIIEAAKTWLIDNIDQATIPDGDSSKTLKVYLFNNEDSLATGGYIESDLENPMTNDKYDPDTYVEITINKNSDSDKLKYDYELIGEDIDCK